MILATFAGAIFGCEQRFRREYIKAKISRSTNEMSDNRLQYCLERYRAVIEMKFISTEFMLDHVKRALRIQRAAQNRIIAYILYLVRSSSLT